MLKSVTLRRFKNLRDVTIPLGRVNVLIGTNNSGKSSVLQGIQFAVSVAQTSRLFGVSTLAPEQLIYAPLRDVAALAEGGHLAQHKSTAIEVVFTQELVGVADIAVESNTTVQIRRGKNANLAVTVVDGGLQTAMESLANPFAMYVPGLAGIPSSEPYRTPAALRRASARGDANAVLRNVLLSLKSDPESWTAFSTNLHSVFPDHHVVVRFDPNVDELVEAEVASPRGMFPIDAAGTGFLQTVQILAYAAKYRPPLLLLDEPDSHIHPDRQRRLVALLAKLAQEQEFQVLIATHSRHLLDTMDGRAVFHWMQDGKRQADADYDRVAVLMDLGALDRSDGLKSGTVDGVVLTEDETAADTHPKKGKSAIRTLLLASGVNLDRVQVWSYRGCTNVETALVLAEFIKENAPNARVLVHRDRDYEPDADIDKFKKRLEDAGIGVFVTHGTDAESHLVNAAHVAARYGALNEADITAAIDDATASARDDSLQRYSVAEDKRLKFAKDKPSSFEIMRVCESNLDADPARFRYGKKVLGVLTSKVQSLLRATPNLYVATQHAAVPELEAFATSIAPVAAPAPPAVPPATAAPPLPPVAPPAAQVTP